MKKNPKKPAAGIGDDAVRKATGKSWAQWIAVLDKAGCRSMSHRQIVAVVHEKFDVGPWWRQMVTVGYEQAAGLRGKHERPDGYQINRSKTIAAPVATVYKAWTDLKQRALWLTDPDFTIRTSIAGKSLRITWGDGKSNLVVMFYKKQPAKTLITVEHGKLPDARTAAKRQRYWTRELANLSAFLAK